MYFVSKNSYIFSTLFTNFKLNTYSIPNINAKANTPSNAIITFVYLINNNINATYPIKLIIAITPFVLYL